MDVNNDGLFDLVYPSEYNLVLSLNNGGTYSETVLLNNINATLASYEVYPVDYNNNGWMDILVVDEHADVIRWLRNNQNNTFEDMGSIYTLPLNETFYLLAIEDLNNDGLIDVISQREASVFTKVNYLLNNGTNLINQQEITSVLSNGFEEYAIEFHDFNGDSFLDVIVYLEKDNGGRTINVYENDSGTILNNVHGENLSINGRWMGLADMTQDGFNDLCYGKYVNGGSNELVIIPSNGDGTFSAAQTQPFDEEFYDQKMVDVNNDGLADLVSRSYVAFNTGSGLAAAVPHNIGLNSITQYLDYDQDGDIDIFSNRTRGRGFIYENLFIGENKIFGNVFYDTNGNGVKDTGEEPVSELKIGVDGFGSYFYSDDLGNFIFPLGGNSGSFQVSSESLYNNLFTFTTPYPAVANISDQNPMDTVAIGLQTTGDTLAYHLMSGNQRCNEVGRIWLNYFNLRPSISNGSLELTLPNNITFTGNAAIAPSSINNQTLSWDLGNMGIIDNEQIWVDLINPDFQYAGDTITFFSKMQTWIGTDTLTVLDTHYFVLICAYDPNDKIISNIQNFAQGDAYYTTQDKVEYVVRFQNTGTASATNVIVRDNFSTNFDYDSFELLSTSHSARVSLNNQGLMEANFENINLPDSTTDFTGSMGYIAFRIRLKENAEQEKDIPNGARIYFDQNPPIYTNVPKFQRVDCEHFLQLQTSVGTVCGNAFDTAFVYDYGVSQNYEWTFNNNLVANSDTASFFIPGNGTFPLQLQTTNQLCSADTIVEMTITQSAPETLGLGVEGDTTICANTGVSIPSVVPVVWTDSNGNSGSPTTNELIFFGGNYTVTNFIGVCKLTEEVEIIVEEFSYEPADYFTDYPTGGYVFCLGEPMQFLSVFNSPSYWVFSGTGNQQYFGDPVTIPTDVNSGLNTATVQVVVDTLNCQIWAYADITFVEDLNFDNNAPQEYMLCDGITDSVGVNLQTTPSDMDSLQIYQNGILVNTYYSNPPTELFLNQAGSYEFIGFLACHETSVTVNVEDFDQMIPDLLVTTDSLYASLGESVNWFYSEDVNTNFNSLSAGSAVLNPANGYYYFSFEMGNCIHLSDTVFVNMVNTHSALSNDIKMNFNMENKTIWVSGEIPLGTQLEIYDAAGKKVLEKKLEANQYINSLPT